MLEFTQNLNGMSLALYKGKGDFMTYTILDYRILRKEYKRKREIDLRVERKLKIKKVPTSSSDVGTDRK